VSVLKTNVVEDMAVVLLQEKEVDELEEKVEPTWEALVQPLEKIKDRLTVAWGIVSHLKAVKDSPELREAVETVQVLTIL
jgi:oligopeptidase A